MRLGRVGRGRAAHELCDLAVADGHRGHDAVDMRCDMCESLIYGRDTPAGWQRGGVDAHDGQQLVIVVDKGTCTSLHHPELCMHVCCHMRNLSL